MLFDGRSLRRTRRASPDLRQLRSMQMNTLRCDWPGSRRRSGAGRSLCASP